MTTKMSLFNSLIDLSIPEIMMDSEFVDMLLYGYTRLSKGHNL